MHWQVAVGPNLLDYGRRRAGGESRQKAAEKRRQRPAAGPRGWQWLGGLKAGLRAQSAVRPRAFDRLELPAAGAAGYSCCADTVSLQTAGD